MLKSFLITQKVSENFEHGSTVYNLNKEGTQTIQVVEEDLLSEHAVLLMPMRTSLPPPWKPQRPYIMRNGAPPVTLVSDTRWINGTLYEIYWIIYGEPCFAYSRYSWNHLSTETIHLATSIRVLMVTWPTSHKLQLLDIAVSTPLRAQYNAAVDSWLLTLYHTLRQTC